MTQMLPEPAHVDAPPPSDERHTVGVSQGRLILRRFLSNKVAVVYMTGAQLLDEFCCCNADIKSI